MLETKSIKVQEILKEINEKVQQKAGRFEKISEDIVLENLTLQALRFWASVWAQASVSMSVPAFCVRC